MEAEMKNLYFILLIALILSGCSTFKGFDERIKYSYHIQDQKIKTICWITGANPVNSKRDSVLVDFAFLLDIPTVLCDSLIIDDISWTTKDSLYLFHVSPAYPYKQGGYDDKLEWLVSLEKNNYLNFVTIPINTSQTNLELIYRFEKDKIYSDYFHLDIPVNITNRTLIQMWEPE